MIGVCLIQLDDAEYAVGVAVKAKKGTEMDMQELKQQLDDVTKAKQEVRRATLILFCSSERLLTVNIQLNLCSKKIEALQVELFMFSYILFYRILSYLIFEELFLLLFEFLCVCALFSIFLFLSVIVFIFAFSRLVRLYF